MGELPTPIHTKAVIEPVVNWEHRGTEALKKFFGVLYGPSGRLATASDHYLHSYQPGSTPGVTNSLDAHIKNTGKVYKNSVGGDPIIEHMVNSATALTNQVEDRLKVIRALTPESSPSHARLSNASNETSGLLKKLCGTKNIPEFNDAAQKIITSLDREVSGLRAGATSGQEAAQGVERLSKTEQNDFGVWWQTHYKDESGQTIARYQQSLQAFAETAHNNNAIYHGATKSVLNEVSIDPTESFRGFVNEFRQSRFPQVQK